MKKKIVFLIFAFQLLLITFSSFAFCQKTKSFPIDTNKIDSIVHLGMKMKAYPGCQVFVSFNGKAVYNKSYGFYTYSEKKKVKSTDLYDLASVTKVAATTLCLMKLYDEKQIVLDDPLNKYLPYLKNTNKESMTIREVMAHQACLSAWVPFYKKTLVNGNHLNPDIFSNHKTSLFSIHVAENIFMRNDYRDSLYYTIAKTPLLKGENGKCKYLYSDLGFYLFADMIQKLTGKPENEYADETFYKPMGLKRITYCPLNKLGLDEIVPTENDTVFRHQLVHGFVHDPGAAMLGGVSGHAGLFADASDLGELMLMLLQNGAYKGRQYISPATIKEFTRCQYPENANRRGLGFDKPFISETKHKDLNGPCSEDASKSSYGHSGFTGTYIWVDPLYKLVYVFLSNRVYPDENNKKLAEMNIRTNIQQVLYDGLNK